jgi:hypothetical protein
MLLGQSSSVIGAVFVASVSCEKLPYELLYHLKMLDVVVMSALLRSEMSQKFSILNHLIPLHPKSIM